MNTFGELLRLTTFGESHGPALGMVLDGCPAGVPLSLDDLQRALDRRRPGQSALVSQRREPDQVELLSGLYDGKTLGTPIAALVRNVDARSADYFAMERQPRRGHADTAWQARFKHRDPRGGGRASGRETVSRVMGGAVAEALLRRDLPGVRLVGWVSGVGEIEATPPGTELTREDVDAHRTRCPDRVAAGLMDRAILDAREQGDSLGGAVTLRIVGLPVGLGEPVFGKLKAQLAAALTSVGTVSGVWFGPPNLPARLRAPGSRFHSEPTAYGGIQGGLASGDPVEARVLHKPVSTLGDLARAGRHDPCILPRVVPVLEAMAALVIADLWLQYLAHPHRA